MRSTGRKDRHSKVCTAKGPRDRRVRLSAHTAIQFYDVQDRLGYDRPSKAVDWLIKNAKAAIDELDELPAWKPAAALTNADNKSESPVGDPLLPEEGGPSCVGGGVYIGNNVESSGLLPTSMDTDSIADTIKTFFPGGGEASSVHEAAAITAATSSVVQFQSYASSDLLPRRGSSQSQDLKLSLQSFQDSIITQSQHQHQHSHQNQEEEQRSRFPGAAQLGFDNPSAGWDETQQADIGRFQRLIGWNLASGGYGGGGGGGGGSGFMFFPQQPLQQPLLFGHGVGHAAPHFFPQGGSLQSNNSSLVRACIGDNAVGNATSNQGHHHQAFPVQPVSLSGIGFTSFNGFSGFHIPARIQGDEEEEDGNPSRQSAPSSSRR